MLVGPQSTETLNSYLTVNKPTDDTTDGIARFRDNGFTQVEINPASYTYQFQVFGEAWTNGSWNTSDRKLKESIQPLNGALESLKKLKPSTYHFKHAENKSLNLPEELQFGLIAQELKEIFPNLVKESSIINEEDEFNDTIHSINYTGLVPILIKSIQEMDQVIIEKENAIQSLQKQLVELDNRLKALEN